MLKRFVLAILISAYALGLTLSGPLNVGAGSLSKPISNPISTPVPGPISKPLPGPVSLYITGHIRVLTSPISGIKVRLFSITKTSPILKAVTYTDSQGAYRFDTSIQGSYIVEPQDSNYTFSPFQQFVTLVRSSFSNIDFLATHN